MRTLTGPISRPKLRLLKNIFLYRMQKHAGGSKDGLLEEAENGPAT